MSKIKFVYDAWGNCTITHDSNGFASRNPFRYRGYYWDSDLGMYYLMTRYYDPKIGRFINADAIEYLKPESINGLNLYAYCGSNPVMYIDTFGSSSSYNILGFSINNGKEKATSFYYFLICSVETGIGYSKSFDNEKVINYFIELPENPLEFWEYSHGINIQNKDGIGISIASGTEISISFHTADNSVELYVNALGRIGIQHAYETEHGEYAYTKYEINTPELVAVAILTIEAIKWLASAASTIGAAGIGIFAI